MTSTHASPVPAPRTQRNIASPRRVL